MEHLGNNPRSNSFHRRLKNSKMGFVELSDNHSSSRRMDLDILKLRKIRRQRTRWIRINIINSSSSGLQQNLFIV